MSKNIYNKYGVNVKNESMFNKMMVCGKVEPKLFGIRAFTSSNYFLQNLCILNGFKFTRLEDNILVITYKNSSIKFSKLSDLLLTNEEQLKLIELRREELLDMERRNRKCHNRSIEFIIFGDYLVTGYIDSSDGNSRIIHSWIEKDDKVIEYTNNLVIDKDDYYKLRNVEVLSVVSREDVFSDVESEIATILGCKFYCLFRDELYNEGLIEFGNRELAKKIKV